MRGFPTKVQYFFSQEENERMEYKRRGMAMQSAMDDKGHEGNDDEGESESEI